MHNFVTEIPTYLYFRIFMADEVEICQKLVPLMFPNMIRVHIHINMVITRDKFPTSEQRKNFFCKKNSVKKIIIYIYLPEQRKFHNASTGLGFETFDSSRAKFFIFHAEPLQNTNTGSNAVIINKGSFFFII